MSKLIAFGIVAATAAVLEYCAARAANQPRNWCEPGLVVWGCAVGLLLDFAINGGA